MRIAGAVPGLAGLSPIRRRQLGTIVRLELSKNLRSWRGLWLYLLALLPVLPIAVHTLDAFLRGRAAEHALDQDTTVLAGIFQFYYLRLGIFFGCLGLFTRLFRGEMMERSLHHYLLAPVRRELLTLGKFLAGLVISVATFGTAVLLSFLLMYLHFGAEARSFVFAGPGLGHLASYLLVTALACLGYGSLFLLLGLLARNPILPAVPILLWESMNHILPSSLKFLSVVFYLEPLLPVEVPASNDLLTFFAIPADPVSTAIALPSLILVSSIILLAACLKARNTEINYAD
jgi:ABC-type transport system involved in multi-copper enzyme maturation permease subunit